MNSSDQRLFAEYKKIRNRFRKSNSDQLIFAILNYINEDVEPLERLRRQPWHAMLLVKWILIDRPPKGGRGTKVSRNEVIRIMNMMFDLQDRIRNLEEFEHFVLFLRSAGNQQFLFQQEFSTPHFMRQFELFWDLPRGHKFRRAFKKKMNLEIDNFLLLSFSLLIRFLKENHSYVDANWFQNLAIEPEEIEQFLESVSGSFDHIQDFLSGIASPKMRWSEYYESSPLTSIPLFQIHDRFYLFDRNILFRGLEHFIYDTLRAEDPSGFMNRFGKIFEHYVGVNLDKSKVDYVREEQLESLDCGDKVVDFVVPSSGANIMIDAKGVAGSHNALVASRSRIVRDQTRNSAIKGIHQALDTARRINRGDYQTLGIEKSSENFFIVVTYKNLYLTNGRVFCDAIAGKEFSDLIDESYPETGLSADNIYFLLIDDFEYLCDAVKDGNITFERALRDARAVDADLRTAKHSFRLHLNDWNLTAGIPEITSERLDEVVDGAVRDLFDQYS